MNQDLIQLISHYLDIDEVYKIKSTLNLNIKIYLKYVKCPTGNEDSYRNCRNEHWMKGNKTNMAWACNNGYLEIVKHNISQNMKFHNDNPMFWACLCGNLEMIKYLNTETEYYYEDGVSFAVQNNNIEVLKYLCEEGNGSNRMDAMLIFSIECGFPRITKYLKSIGEYLSDDDKRSLFLRLSEARVISTSYPRTFWDNIMSLKCLDIYMGNDNFSELSRKINLILSPFSEKIVNIILEYLYQKIEKS